MRWDEMRWDEMRWDEMRWDGIRSRTQGVVSQFPEPGAQDTSVWQAL